MDYKMRKECRRSIRFSALLLGIIVGSIFFVFFKTNSSDILKQGLIQFDVMRAADITDQKISLYILKRRLISIFLLVFTAKCLTVPVTDIGIHLIFGLYYGFVVSNLFCYSFLNGWVYGFLCFFPHYLFYIFAFWEICKFLMCDKSESNNANVKKIKYFFRIFVIILCVGLGVVWEIYVQKNILKIFYQHLV
ncbi:MAG: hypothetical protein Q4D51_09840 [Eubacteriales bacterium]|nr:hypothetical protein [Eubacteriales bacterium]